MYNPKPRTAEILQYALKVVRSVPYQVSARWVFYRLLQAGFYSTKDDYKNKFLPAVSDARHENWGGWRPDTLADETRQPIVRGSGFDGADDWMRAVARMKCNLDHWRDQSYYVELWYEARAMTDQFEHYTDYLTLRPMGGQPSIPYKYATAQALDRAHSDYGSKVVVLYFGDLDTAGEMIAHVVERDVRKWCKVDFSFKRCGLTPEQITRFNVPENFDHPGAYQWEALDDTAARTIIEEGVAQYIDRDAFAEVERRQVAISDWFKGAVSELEYEGE